MLRLSPHRDDECGPLVAMKRVLVLPSRDDSLASFLNGHEGAFTRDELTRLFSRRALENALRDRDVCRLLPGIYCGKTQSRSVDTRVEALVLWNPHLWISGALALCLYEPSLPAPAYDDVVALRGNHVRTPARVRLKQVRRIPPGRARGLARVVSPAFAVIDAWNRTRPWERTDVLYGALWSGVARPDGVLAELRDQPRVTDRRAIEGILTWCVDGAMSPLEVMGHRDVFAGPEWRVWERQVPLDVPGSRYVADMVHRDSRTVIEFDGDRFHSSAAARARDARRDAELAAEGWMTVRLRWAQLRDDAEGCRNIVRRVLAQRPTRFQ